MSNDKNTLFVIGAGQMRTGTQSLKLALERLYGAKCYHMYEIIDCHPDHIDIWIKAFDQGHIDLSICDKVFAGYACAVDHPASVFYKDLMAIYPDAKVILTTRNTDSWIKSVTSTTLKKSLFNEFQKIILFRCFGLSKFEEFVRKLLWHCFHKSIECLTDDKNELKQSFEEYNAEVRRSVPTERLLVFEAKEGWEPLCRFLNLPVPDEPYPFVNNTEEFNSKIRNRVFGKLLKFGSILSAAVAVGIVFLKQYSYI